MADEYLNQIDENEKDKLIDLVVPNERELLGLSA